MVGLRGSAMGCPMLSRRPPAAGLGFMPDWSQALAEQIDPQRITDGLTRIMHSAEYSGAPEGDFPRESDL